MPCCLFFRSFLVPWRQCQCFEADDAMSEYLQAHLGFLTDYRAIRFERKFSQAIDDVWKHISDEKLLAGWIADASVDLRVGGKIELRFREEDDPEGYCKGENVSGGTIIACQAPELLKFVFASPHAGETILTYTLKPIDDGTLFTLDHSALPPELMVAFAAGWHSYLEALAARLRGDEPQPFAPVFEEQIKRYAFFLAASVIATQPVSAHMDPALFQAEKKERNLLLEKYDRLCADEDNLKWQITEQQRSNSAYASKEIDYLTKTLKDKQRKLHEIELDLRDLKNRFMHAEASAAN